MAIEPLQEAQGGKSSRSRAPQRGEESCTGYLWSCLLLRDRLAFFYSNPDAIFKALKQANGAFLSQEMVCVAKPRRQTCCAWSLLWWAVLQRAGLGGWRLVLGCSPQRCRIQAAALCSPACGRGNSVRAWGNPPCPWGWRRSLVLYKHLSCRTGPCETSSFVMGTEPETWRP